LADIDEKLNQQGKDTLTENEDALESVGESAYASKNKSSPRTVLNLSRLNKMLSRLAGTEFRISLYVGEQVNQLDDSILAALATCYAKLAREKWYENWTAESAREELEKYFKADEDRINIISLVFRGEEVIGFCWAFIIAANNPGNLAAHFSSSKLSNKDNLNATVEWLAQAGGKEKLVCIRDLGVLKQYKKIRAPLLCSPVFARALGFDCKYIFLRIPVSSESLQWIMGIGFVPVHYFVVNQMLLMLGDLEHSVKEYDFRILDYFALQMSAILDQDKDFDAIMQQTELNYEDKMQVMQDLSANIAHEMRTPLSGVRASMDGIESYLPLLVQTYRKQLSENPETVQAIREDHLNTLEKTPERIALMVDQANSVIDMLLMNLRDNTVDKSQYSIYSAADLIYQALDRYPFKRGERDKVSVHIDHDFYFRGLDNLFIFVIFNLLKNALYSINSALKGQITIELKPGKGVNRIIFRDTGEGIDRKVVGRIFDGFYTTRSDGTGVGLAFCRRTIHSFDGDISCLAESGEFAEFTIDLPAT